MKEKEKDFAAYQEMKMRVVQACFQMRGKNWHACLRLGADTTFNLFYGRKSKNGIRGLV